MLKTFALWFGIVFLLIGILGFLPALAPEGMLFGIFQVGVMHNIVHMASGVIALLAAGAGERASRLFFQIFGLAYGLVAVIGFFYGDAPLLGIMAHNWADVWLHVAVAAFALILGFGSRRPVPGHAPIRT
ncbi:MAG: DUF4383 domain-containing protein [Chromatocurvus sp.]